MVTLLHFSKLQIPLFVAYHLHRKIQDDVNKCFGDAVLHLRFS